LLAVILGCFTAWVQVCHAQPAVGNPQISGEVRIVELQGAVEIFTGSATWSPVQTNQILHPFDRLRTGANSRIALRWSDQSVIAFGASTELEILPPRTPGDQSGLHLIRGIISFFHRDQPGRIQIITRGAVAGVEGTEFVMAVDDADKTTLAVVDGKVKFGNEQAALLLTNGQQAEIELGKAPALTAGFIANNLLQWSFYYPAVLDPDELQLTADEQTNLAASLDAYRSGDLPASLANYPTNRAPVSDSEKIYFAGLLLSVGQVEKSGALISSIHSPPANALREVAAAVKFQTWPSTNNSPLATTLLADSYYLQSRSQLGAALAAAQAAAKKSPMSGFAWERVAELEFSFGRTADALEALIKSLALAPRNAQALALKGFLLAAQNQTHDAIASFDQALAVDSALGNAWFGRGLCKIRRGDANGGREDLLVAAALEPQRAALRSYLGKAYANAGDFARAAKEFQLAKKLDPNDPTAWLYSALLNQQNNLINDAIRDLEKSESLNDNRSVYRSQLLLDQDQAVRSASLATMYQDAGMSDVSVRAAARAVNHDYANYSAHLFLADSYNSLRDPNEINLRYETPAESEYLVANLLAPVSAGPLSAAISQGEYSRLFTHDGFGVTSDTEYLSRGAWTQSGAQFGVFGDFSYDFEALYRSDPGQRVNDNIEQRQLSLTLKEQLTPKDSVSVNVQQYEAESGDLSQYYDQSMANPDARVKETQTPNVSLGYHHEWSPGVHTLFLATRLQDTTSFTNPTDPTLVAFRPDVDPITMPGVTELTSVQGLTMNEYFKNRLTIYSGELQQIWEAPEHTTIVGARIQYGNFDMNNLQDAPSTLGTIFPFPPAPDAQQDITSLFKRVSFYGYHQWQIFEPLQLIGGLAYDRITFPENFRSAPISGTGKTVDQFSPKAGIIWTPEENTTARFAYTRSLSGASVDQSYQLEPSQVAGFIQNYRSIIPESIAGANAGAQFETFDLSLEQKFRTGTYLGVSGEILNSTVNRIAGAFDYLPDELEFPVPSGLNEKLDYTEKTLTVTANQLLGRDWSFGGKYRLSEAVLNDNYVDVPNSLVGGFVDFTPRQQMQGILNQLDLTAIYNHPCGFFAEGEALWSAQSNDGYMPGEPGDDFWQGNLYAGYRALHRKMELTVGLLNVAGQDYHLNPLNIYDELPRSRTLMVRLKLNF
jgi:tetratricopeptide (TPR) repeat protein